MQETRNLLIHSLQFRESLYFGTMLEILFRNEDIIAIHKPHGLLVHKTKIALDATEFAVQMLRDQIGQHVYPAHRLDRKTAGILIFTTSSKLNSEIQQLFLNRKVQKTYHAIVRGFAPTEMNIDYDLEVDGKIQNAITDLKLIRHFEIGLPFGEFKTSRYSLVELTPKTGRFHQLRKHMAHIRHPILGDRPHGCNKQNKLWKEQFNMTTMMLCAMQTSFTYAEDKHVDISCKYSSEMKGVLDHLVSSHIN